MSKLIQIKGNTYYIPGSVNIGVIRNEKEPEKSIVIDTGLDDDAARKLLKILAEHGMGVGSIINTHSHADHCGGNSFIASRTSARIYASGIEKAFIEHTLLEPFCLFSALPMKELDVKFLRAKPSKVEAELEEGEACIDGVKLQIIALGGHSPGMLGVVTEDNVFFLGDAVFSEEIIAKYGLLYMTDVKAALETLEYIKTLDYDYYVPCHGTPAEDIRLAAQANIASIRAVESELLKFCTIAADRERLVSRIVEKYNIKLTVPQYYLTLSTVSAFLSHMTDAGKLEMVFDENRLKWHRIID